jgi:hypothetical protein
MNAPLATPPQSCFESKVMEKPLVQSAEIVDDVRSNCQCQNKTSQIHCPLGQLANKGFRAEMLD